MKKPLELKDRESTERPAWTQDDLHAYKNKFVPGMKIDNDVRPPILHNYYIRSKGRQ